jgi:DNA repair protein RecN (Recombination protein N)
MLTHLQLRDLAIVDRVELEFSAGLSALTGETGAGKSIIVDALLLAAGGRAGTDVVRHGAERAEVSASFTVPKGAAADWLQEQSIEHHGEVILRRVIGADGRSRAYLNGQIVSLQALREFADFVIEIHGQQEFQHLIKRSEQRSLLDAHSVPPQAIDKVAKLYAEYRVCRDQFEALQSAAANRDSRLDYLQFQLAELKADVTSREEIEQLLSEQKRFANRGRLAEGARAALELTYEADAGNAHDLLAKAGAAIRVPAETDPELAAAAALLQEAQVSAREAASALQHYLQALDIDPARLEELERRAANLESLARKHRVAVTDLPQQLAETERELNALLASGVTLSELEQNLARLSAEYGAAAAGLSKARQVAAKDLSARITKLMQALGMVGGRFEVQVQNGAGEFAVHGVDDIEFLVSANPGQPVKPLAKVASGGELSRISLAIQVAAASNTASICMVFDEVDAGVGGAVAEIVGRQLRELGNRAQVLCVTHLPQVAAQAHSQFRVAKLSDGKTTRTSVNTLNPNERIEEIARMLGGVSITDKAREHAREMLSLRPETAKGAASPAAAKPKARRAST